MRGSGQLLYGSDFPFTPARGVEPRIAAVDAAAVPVEGAPLGSRRPGATPGSRYLA